MDNKTNEEPIPVCSARIGPPGTSPRVRIDFGTDGKGTKVFFDEKPVKGLAHVLLEARAAKSTDLELIALKTKNLDIDSDFLEYMRASGFTVLVRDFEKEIAARSEGLKEVELSDGRRAQTCDGTIVAILNDPTHEAAPDYFSTPETGVLAGVTVEGFFVVPLAQIDLSRRFAVSTDKGAWVGLVTVNPPPWRMTEEGTRTQASAHVHRQVLALIADVRSGKIQPQMIESEALPIPNLHVDRLRIALENDMDNDNPEVRSVARYYDAILRGLSDYEAREEGWPTA
jgi:hypothetical protein